MQSETDANNDGFANCGADDDEEDDNNGNEEDIDVVDVNAANDDGDTDDVNEEEEDEDDNEEEEEEGKEEMTTTSGSEKEHAINSFRHDILCIGTCEYCITSPQSTQVTFRAEQTSGCLTRSGFKMS